MYARRLRGMFRASPGEASTPLRLFSIRFDWGYLVVFAICLLAIWPFLKYPSLPQQTDSELHIFRLAELSRLVREGIFYPRWAPNFYFGYGYPIFNYYAPLAYYLGLPLELLPRVGPVEAVKALFIAGYLAAAFGVYGFVRLVWGRIGGVVSSAACVYAPYLLFVDPHARGDLPEFLSFGVLGLTLWSLESLRQAPSTLKMIVTTLLVAAIVLVHNLMSIILWGLVLGWVIWQVLPEILPSQQRHQRTIDLRWCLPVIFGLGLAGFFWLPVVLERGAVNLGSLIGEGGHFDYRNHFLTLGQLTASSKRIDWGATAADYVLNIGQAQLLFFFLGTITLFLPSTEGKRRLVFFVIVSLVATILMLPESQFIWELVPLLPFMQFPWRFLGPVAALMAIVAGAGVQNIFEQLPKSGRMIAPVLAVIALMIPGLTLIQIAPWPEDFGPTSRVRVLEEELSGRWLGTTSTADFVPASVEVLPKPEQSLIEVFYSGGPLDRLNRVTLPEGVKAEFEQVNPLSYRYHISADQDFLLRLFLFDFPGWEARIDGTLATTELGRPEGFLVVPVSAGEHLVEVKFTTTTARRVGAGVTFLAAITTLAISISYKTNPSSTEEGKKLSRNANRRSFGTGLAIVAAVILLTIIDIVILEPSGTLHLKSDGYFIEPAANKTRVDFGAQVFLLGYDLSKNEAVPGDNIWVTAYWKAQHILDINYQVFVHLLDEDGKLVAQSDKLNPGDFPTKRWPLDKYVRDQHQIALPETLSPGEYSLSVGLWVAEEGWRLPVLDRDGRTVGDNYRLSGPIFIR